MKKFLKKLGKGIWNGIKILIILVLLAILILGIYFYAKYAKPILAFGSAKITSASVAKLAVTPPIVGSVRTEQ